MGNICARDENEPEDNGNNPLGNGMKHAHPALPERREHTQGGFDGAYSPTHPLGRSILEQSSFATDWETTQATNKVGPAVQRNIDIKRFRRVQDFPELRDHYATPTSTLKNTKNHDTYQGQVIRGIPEGWGVIFASTGEVVEGLFKNGQPHSHIRYFYSDGSMYEGDFKNKIFCGRGTHYRADGSSVTCNTWVDGRAIGSYEERDPKGTLIFRGLRGPDGKLEGSCLIAIRDFTVEGAFQRGVATGPMNKTYANGQTYIGALNADMLEEGQGHVTFIDGRQFKGPFTKGVPHGEGIFFNDSGKEIKQKWINGKRA
jgi:hypothetical protein